jgi:N-hydroxyarylamine O-acetyltransferase
MDADQARAYLKRIGSGYAGPPDHMRLRLLQRAHLRTVPFENLSIHLGEPIVLDEDQLFEKIVVRRRGGFCYELNGLFAALLRHLGYRVELLQARVHGKEGYGPPFDHMAIRVLLDRPYLVDVGFGKFAAEPLRLDTGEAQHDPAGRFHVDDVGPHIDVFEGGEPQYRLDPRPCRLADFGPTCFWQSHSAESHFTRSLMCSAPTGTGRVTISGDRLIITEPDGTRTEKKLESDAEVLDAYRDFFGIELSRVPRVTGV